MTELFYTMSEKAAALGEIGVMKTCIMGKVPFQDIDMDIKGWITDLISRKSVRESVYLKLENNVSELRKIR